MRSNRHSISRQPLGRLERPLRVANIAFPGGNPAGSGPMRLLRLLPSPTVFATVRMTCGHHREMKSSVRPPGCKLGSRSVWSLTGPRAPEARSLEAAPSLDEAVGSRSPDEGGCQPPKQCGTTQALALRYLRSFVAPEARREGQYFTPDSLGLPRIEHVGQNAALQPRR